MLMCGCEWIDGPTVHNVRHVTARKPHKCCECGRTIEPGEVYERVFGVWDGVAAHYKTCESCEDLRMSLEAMGFCPAYGYVREDHREYIAEYQPPKLVR